MLIPAETNPQTKQHRWLAFLERNATRMDAVRVLAMLPERTTPLQVLAPYLAKVNYTCIHTYIHISTYMIILSQGDRRAAVLFCAVHECGGP